MRRHLRPSVRVALQFVTVAIVLFISGVETVSWQSIGMMFLGLLVTLLNLIILEKF